MYNNFMVFRCLVYVYDNIRNQDKFSEIGRPYVFLGYQMGKKDYKFYDIKGEKIYSSRNVTFIDHIFPFGNDDKTKNNLEDTNFSESLTKLQQVIANENEL